MKIKPYTQIQLLNACKARIYGSGDSLCKAFTPVFEAAVIKRRGDVDVAVVDIRAKGKSNGSIESMLASFLRRVEYDAHTWPNVTSWMKASAVVRVVNNWRIRRRLPRITALATKLGYVDPSNPYSGD